MNSDSTSLTYLLLMRRTSHEVTIDNNKKPQTIGSAGYVLSNIVEAFSMREMFLTAAIATYKVSYSAVDNNSSILMLTY